MAERPDQVQFVARSARSQPGGEGVRVSFDQEGELAGGQASRKERMAQITGAGGQVKLAWVAGFCRVWGRDSNLPPRRAECPAFDDRRARLLHVPASGLLSG